MLNEVKRGLEQELHAMPRFPVGAVYHFGSEKEEGEERLPRVAKSVRRTVVSLCYSQFEARETVGRGCDGAATGLRRSAELAAVVPTGQRYAYDLIAYVGLETFIERRTLQDVQEDLRAEYPGVAFPLSSLYDVQRKFLFYLGALHWDAAPRLREYLRQRKGRTTWLIDGTVEPGTPVFFGVLDAQEGLMLHCGKFATENEPDIRSSLREAARRYGWPDEVLHDLSAAMSRACQAALPGVHHRVCQQHLLRDVGTDLYRRPQLALSGLVRSLKLQARLKEQRRGQTEALRMLEDPEATMVLGSLLAGEEITVDDLGLLGRQVAMGVHQWVLDFSSDGRRQGAPFDPYTLYFHRRVVRASAILRQLLDQDAVSREAPRVLSSLAGVLEEYLANPKVVVAAAEYEESWELFERLRCTLRLTAQGDAPLRACYYLAGEDEVEVRQALAALRGECREKSEHSSDEGERGRCRIVCEHLDRYWDALFVAAEPTGEEGARVRTTNRLEASWGRSKRARRQAHGRSKLTRDFQSLPAEYMLVANLENPRYVEVVLGSLSDLPEKLAEAGKTAGPFSKWAEKQHPANLGRLPKRQVRKPAFLDKLADTYERQCGAVVR